MIPYTDGSTVRLTQKFQSAFRRSRESSDVAYRRRHVSGQRGGQTFKTEAENGSARALFVMTLHFLPGHDRAGLRLRQCPDENLPITIEGEKLKSDVLCWHQKLHDPRHDLSPLARRRGRSAPCSYARNRWRSFRIVPCDCECHRCSCEFEWPHRDALASLDICRESERSGL